MNLTTKMRYFYSTLARTLQLFSGYPLTITNAVAGNLNEYTVLGNSNQEGTPTPSAPIDITSVGDSVLPSSYTQLEYIQSSGTQYIDTGILGSNITRFKVKGYCAPKGTSNAQLIGGDGTDTLPSSFYGSRADSINANWYAMDASAQALVPSSVWATTDATINSATSQTGTIINESTGLSYEFAKFSNAAWGFTAGNLFIFGGSPARRSPDAKISYLKLYTSAGLVFDGIAAKRNSDNEIGVYDTVSGQFFTNQGTDSFIAGSVVQPSSYKIPVINGDNCGVVDLGTLNWAYRPDLGDGVFTSPFNGYDKQAGNTNLSLAGYTTVNRSGTGLNNLEVCGHGTTTRIYVCNTDYSDVATFKNAMSGKYLYYQRTTDDTWTIPTTTSIYTSAPLCKVGTYTDVLNSDGTITRNVGVKVLDGTENWTNASSGTKHIYHTAIGDRKTSGDYGYGLCTHFGYSTGTSSTCPDLNMFYYGSQNTGFRYDAITTLNDFKSWLAAQYAAGTPVIILYPLATPTTEVNATPVLTMSRGTNTITTGTELVPSNMTAKAWTE